MKLKILVKLMEKLFGITMDGDEPRADMYLPDRLLAMSAVLMAIGLACGACTVIRCEIWWGVGAALNIGLGVFALLCWKNQKIHMISDEQFTYTTMFGNTRTYSFTDIQGLRRNQDSLTLFVANQKVHMESMAVISDRLSKRIHMALMFDGKYLKMSVSALSQLTDDKLIEAVGTRTENAVASKDDLLEGFHSLNDEQRIFMQLITWKWKSITVDFVSSL